jgi:hypothetical protein
MSPSRALGLALVIFGVEACASGGGSHEMDWGGVPHKARAAADSIYAMLARETRLTPHRSRGEVNSIFRFCARPAARIHFAWRADRPGLDPFAIVDRELPRMGWKLDEATRADGPDGTVYAFTRGKLLCVVEGRWDGGLDDDSTAVIDPGRSLLVDVASADPCKDEGPRH